MPNLEELNGLYRANHESPSHVKAWMALQRGKLIARNNNIAEAVEFAQARLRGANERDLVAKAAVGAVVSADVGGASVASVLNAATMELVRRLELISRLLAFGLRPAPFLERIAVVTSGSTAQWVGGGLPLPVTRPTVDISILELTKVGAIVSFPQKRSRACRRPPSNSSRMIWSALHRVSVDLTLLSDDAAVAGVSPAGLLYGLSPIGGGSASSIADDVFQAWTALRDGEPESPVGITSLRGGAYLASLRGSDGAPMFPNVGPLGGNIWGIPILTAHAAGNRFIWLDAAALAVADGGLETSVSQQAAVQMDDSPTPGAVQLVSGWQTIATFSRLFGC